MGKFRMKKITLINPNIVSQKGDFFGTGIPYMPITLAYLAADLLKKGEDVTVIDAFGEKPMQKETVGNHIIQGLTLNEIIRKIPTDTDVIYIYASQVIQHTRVLEIIAHINNLKGMRFDSNGRTDFYPLQHIPIKILPNTQSVVSYSPKEVKSDFGDAEIVEFIPPENLDDLSFPAWHLFPLRNYWKLGYAHAPYKKRYLPILSSWNCSGKCRFCIIPSVIHGPWQGRSAQNVFDEIRHYVDKFGVKEFEFEDLNPTLSKARIEELCRLLIKEELHIRFKFAAGIKIETIDKNTVRLLNLAGCDYISFSPESGSKQVLKLMQKPFNHEHALDLLKLMKRLDITTQACFILGFPGETIEDLIMTQSYIDELFKAGLDEMAVLVMTAIPGSQIHKELGLGYDDISKYTFSPTWQKNYKALNRLRIKLYLNAMLIRLLYHPLSMFKLRKTKMWMTMYRMLKIRFGGEKC